MKLTSRSEYGLLAMLDLAKHSSVRLVQSHEIARRQNIPEPYLNQLLTVLSRAGLVTSRRGPGGGYLLARPADTISVGEVVALLEGPPSNGHEDGINDRPFVPLIRKLCQQAHEAAAAVLESVTLADLLWQESERAPRYSI
jgi:Rrf2 family protein